MSGRRPDRRPLVAHIVYRFDTGGLENGVVNLINHMPRGAFRHMVVALTEVTVKMYVRAVCAKLRAANRTQAAIIALSTGIV